MTNALLDAPRDDDGLHHHYDVVLLGTGLLQSIVASALARAGKSVLHLDPAEHYGGLETVWTLPYLRETLGKVVSSGTDLTVNKSRDASKSHGGEDAGTGGQISSPHSTTGSTSCNNNSNESKNNIMDNLIISPKGDLETLQIHHMSTQTNFTLQDQSRVDTPYGEGILTSLTPVASSSPDPNNTQPEYSSLSIKLMQWTLANGLHPTLHVGMDAQLFSLQNDTTLEDFLEKHRNITPYTNRLAKEVLQSRAIALDMTPGLVYAAGTAVHGLLQSGVADYLEFKAVEGLYYFDQSSASMNRLERVPCSKADVFGSSLLSPMDKRRLMKFLHLCLDYNQRQQEEESVETLNERHLNQGRSLARPQNKPTEDLEMQALQDAVDQDFDNYLRETQKLSPKLTAIVRHALALQHSPNVTTKEGMASLCRHIQALGRYGTTAFLVPMYGSGEMSQAFCRSAAVYGATYLLRRRLKGLQQQEGHVTGVQIPQDDDDSTTKMISCDHVILPREALVGSSPPQRRVIRRISIVPAEKILSNECGEQRHVTIIPPGTVENNSTIYCLFLDESVSVAPRVPDGCSVIHLTTTVDVDSSGCVIDATVLDRAMKLLSPRVFEREIFRTTLSCALFDEKTDTFDVPDNVHVTHRSHDLALDIVFDQAKRIFGSICPGEEFLAIAKAVEDAVKERIGEIRQEDDDQVVLQSAIGMITKKKNEITES